MAFKSIIGIQNFIYRYNFFLACPEIIAKWYSPVVYIEGDLYDFPQFGAYSSMSLACSHSKDGYFYSGIFYPQKASKIVANNVTSTARFASSLEVSFEGQSFDMSAINGLQAYNYIIRSRVNYLDYVQRNNLSLSENKFLCLTGNTLYSYSYGSFPSAGQKFISDFEA